MHPRNDISAGVELDWQGNTPLHQAVEAWDVVKLKNLLSEDSKHIDAKDSAGQTPLMIAAANGSANAMKLLLEKGANAALQDKLHRSALHLACESIFSADIFQRLIMSGCDINGRDHRGDTPLHYACLKMNLTAMESLLSRGALCDLQNNEANRTPLHYLVMNDIQLPPLYHDALVTLLFYGPNTALKDLNQQTPLQVALGKYPSYSSRMQTRMTTFHQFMFFYPSDQCVKKFFEVNYDPADKYAGFEHVLGIKLFLGSGRKDGNYEERIKEASLLVFLYPEQFRGNEEAIHACLKVAKQLAVIDKVPSNDNALLRLGLQIELEGRPDPDMIMMAKAFKTATPNQGKYVFDFTGITPYGAELLGNLLQCAMKRKRLPAGISIRFRTSPSFFSDDTGLGSIARIQDILKENEKQQATLSCSHTLLRIA